MNPPTGKTAPLSQIPANDLRSVRRRSPGALANGYVGPPSATAQHGPSLAANGTYGYAAANPASFGLQMAADGPLLAVSPVEAAGYAGGPRVPAGATATPLLDTQTFVRGASEHFGYHLDDVGHEGLFQDGSFVLGGWRDRLPAGLQGPAGASFESGPAAPPAAAPTSSGVRTGTVSANVAGGFTQQPLPASPRLAQGAPPAAPVPFVAASPLAPPTIDPMSLVYPELLPIFPYMASPEVASLARNPDVLPDDEMGDGRGRADAVPRKRYNEKLRREAFKNHLTELVQIIPGMQYYSQTRKSVLICAREYVQQLQRRERRLRSMLMAHHMRERALVASLLHRGATAEEIGTLCAESAPGELERVAATVETLVADPAQAEGQTNEFGDAPSGGLAEADGNLS